VRFLKSAAEVVGWRATPLGTDGTFWIAIDVPAGGWYRCEARATRGTAVLAEAAVEHVGVGEVFVVAGQSNSANVGEERLRPATGLVATLDGAGWRPADDPQPGAEGGAEAFYRRLAMRSQSDSAFRSASWPVVSAGRACGSGYPQALRFPRHRPSRAASANGRMGGGIATGAPTRCWCGA